MSQRHRLTITITMALYDELCRLAGPRGLSHWMEDAAWHKIQRHGHGGQAGRVLDEAGEQPQPGLPPPPWCWSPLRPGGADGGRNN